MSADGVYWWVKMTNVINTGKVWCKWLLEMVRFDEILLPVNRIRRFVSDQIVQQWNMTSTIEAELYGGRNWSVFWCVWRVRWSTVTVVAEIWRWRRADSRRGLLRTWGIWNENEKKFNKWFRHLSTYSVHSQGEPKTTLQLVCAYTLALTPSNWWRPSSLVAASWRCWLVAVATVLFNVKFIKYTFKEVLISTRNKSLMWKWNLDWWQKLESCLNKLSKFRFVQILDGINLLSSDRCPDVGQTLLYTVFDTKTWPY